MPCAHRTVDVSQHRTTARPGRRIREVEEEAALVIFWGGGCQREKRPKKYQRVAEPDDCCPSKSMYVIIGWDYKTIQQTAAAATSYHRWLLLQHVAVLRWRERLSEQMWCRLRPHGTLSSIIIISRVGDSDDVAQHMTCSNESSWWEYYTTVYQVPSIALGMVIWMSMLYCTQTAEF